MSTDGGRSDEEEAREERSEEVATKGTRECSAATSSSCKEGRASALVLSCSPCEAEERTRTHLEDVRPGLTRRRGDGGAARVDALLLPADLLGDHAAEVVLTRLATVLRAHAARGVQPWTGARAR